MPKGIRMQIVKAGAPARVFERQIGESPQAYRAFATFREMIPHERSVVGAYRQQKGKPQAKQAAGLWNQWSRQWSWIDRARDWDIEQERLYQSQRFQQRKDLRDRRGRYGRMLQSKALPALNELNPQITAIPLEMLMKLLIEGVKMEAEALGDSMDVPEGVTVAGQEAENYIERLRRLRKQREEED